MKVAGLQGLTGSQRTSSVRFPIFLFLILFLCSSSLHVIAQGSNTSNARVGKRIFSVNCAACHGLDGQGSERGPNIASRREVQRKSDQALLHMVSQGVSGTGMPPFRSLGTQAIQAVVQHLRELQGHSQGEPLTGDPNVGKTLFFGKAECSQCHMVNGEGGFIASDLSSYASGRPANEMRSAITAPGDSNDPRKSAVIVTTTEGKTYRGVVRNEDNFSLQMQTMDGAFHLFNKVELQSFEYEPRSLMPNDYGTRLTRKEMDDLVSFVINASHGHKQQSNTQHPD